MVELAARLSAQVDSWVAELCLAVWERAQLEEHLRLRLTQATQVDRGVHTLHRLHSLVVAWLLPSAFCSLTIAVPANISLYDKRRSWEIYWRKMGKFSWKSKRL